MSRARLFILVGLLQFSGVQFLFSQQVVSGIFGYCNLTLLGNSDTIVAVPFARLPDSTVQVAAISGSTVQFQGTPGWTTNQYVYASGTQSNTYYARIESGALEGRYFDITNNSTDTLWLNAPNSTLTNLAVGDQVSVIPYWTLSTVFVNGNGIVPSTSTIVHNTEVLLPSQTNAGVNLSASATYYYYTNSGSVVWRKFPATANRNDDILPPNAYLIIRQKVATNTTFTSFGDVVLTKINVPIMVNSSNKQDNAIALTRPVQMSLADSGLVGSGAFTPSTSTLIHKDELIVFNNGATNFNKSAAATYYYYNSTWRQFGGPTNDYSTSNILAAGSGFIIRKANTSITPQWTNTATYTNN